MKIKTITNGNVLFTGDNDVLIHKYSPKEEVYLEANSRFPNILYIYSKQGSIIQEIDSSEVIATSLNGVETAFSGTRADLYTLLTTSFFPSSSSGGATSAGQATGNASLASIDGKVSTAANQATGNASLSAIDTKLGALSKAEDAVHSSGDQGIMALSVRRLADTPLSSADGDYQPLATDDRNALKTVNIPRLITKVSTAVTVGTSSTSVLAAVAAGYRAIISIPSTAAGSVWLSFGGTAVLAPPSLELTPGGSYQTQDGYPDTLAITGIAAASTVITVITY